MLGNFLLNANKAVATCFEPPYSRFPATVTSFPVFTILPDIPKISSVEIGFAFVKTKFVWHSGIFL